jgi:hypothetical protein
MLDQGVIDRPLVVILVRPNTPEHPPPKKKPLNPGEASRGPTTLKRSS